MSLPPTLELALAALYAKENSLKSLIDKAAEISDAYRLCEAHTLTTRAHALAYIGARLPATYAATGRVLAEIKSLEIKSLLELGSGVGVALWAARVQHTTLQKAVLVERNPILVSLGQELTRGIDLNLLWRQEGLIPTIDLPFSDLVVMSYVSGELPEVTLEPIIKRSFAMAQKAFVIIEPGTPRGFKRLLKIRGWLLEWGAQILAPCAHQGVCPMQKDDWCHFSVRLPRSNLHRSLKGGAMPYEDEKFSYLIASPVPQVALSEKRVLKAPLERKGHTILDLCAPNEIERQVISRKTPDTYKKAKKLKWGDVWSTE